MVFTLRWVIITYLTKKKKNALILIPSVTDVLENVRIGYF